MRLSRLARALLAPLLLAALACENPTAPQLVAGTEELDREFRDNPAAAADRVWRLLSEGSISRLLPSSLGEIHVTVDGRPRSYRAFVVERVTIPEDAGDGYPCPRVRRTLFAVRGDREGFMLSGADFTREVAPRFDFGCPGLVDSIGRPEWVPPWEPSFHGFLGGGDSAGFHAFGNVAQFHGLDGRARIAPAFVGGEICTELSRPPVDAVEVRETACEAATFEVEMELRVSKMHFPQGSAAFGPGITREEQSPPPVRTGRARRVAAPLQTVPGIRLTTRCGGERRTFGCAVTW